MVRPPDAGFQKKQTRDRHRRVCLGHHTVAADARGIAGKRPAIVGTAWISPAVAPSASCSQVSVSGIRMPSDQHTHDTAALE